MKHIIYDSNAERTLTILKNCHQAMAENDKLLETLIPPDNQPQKWLDLALFLMTGGRKWAHKNRIRELLAFSNARNN